MSQNKADCKPAALVEAKAAEEDLAALGARLRAAERPFMIVGGGGWSRAARDRVMAFAERLDLPTGASFRCQDYFDNRHRNYAGDVGIGLNPKLAARIGEVDLLIALGPRLGEMTSSGYTLFEIPNPRQRLVHVHPGAEELGRVYRADLAINASVRAFAAGLARIDGVDPGRWAGWARAAREDYEAHSEPEETPGEVKLEQVVCHLRDTLPDDAVITNGAGNYTAWVHRYYRYRGYRTQLAPTSGSMGYGLPAAIAAKLAAPERTVVGFAGDGCFLMTGQELATAVQHDLPIVMIVANNGMYGTIRMHQERHYPGRVSATDLHNPDFARLAEAYGAHGETVTRTADFPAAFERALASGKPALIELRLSPEALSPRLTLSGLAKAKAG